MATEPLQSTVKANWPYSRNRKSFHRQYVHIFEALRELPENTVLDGEIVALDDAGRPNFNLLQHFRSKASKICYFVFDLLVFEGTGYSFEHHAHGEGLGIRMW
jgi:ATP-dependent DNA ligase